MATVEKTVHARDKLARKPNGRGRSPRSKNLSDWGLLLASLVVVLSIWEFGAPALGISELVLPRPTQIFAALVGHLDSPAFWGHVLVTFQEAMLGFLIGVSTAMILGTAISQIRLFEKIMMPYIVAFQTVPKVALAPLFVVWFGFGLESKIVMAAVISFFPMLINVVEGLKSAEADRIEMLRVFGASRMQIFRYVRFPGALPFIFAGLDIGVVFSILGAVVGEFVGAQEGLGYLLLQANFNFDIAGMFAVLVVLSMMGLGLHMIIRLLQRIFVSWAEESRAAGS